MVDKYSRPLQSNYAAQVPNYSFPKIDSRVVNPDVRNNLLSYSQSPFLVSQALKPVPDVAPLPAVNLKSKGRWISDPASGKKVFVSNLSDGRVRIEVAKNKAYYEIATSDSYIKRTLANPNSILARHATYRIDTISIGKNSKDSKAGAYNSSPLNTGSDRDYIPPNMDSQDRFIGYAGVDFDTDSRRIQKRIQVLVGKSKNGRGFYIIDAKGIKTDLPDVKTDKEAMKIARNNLRYAGSGIIPTITYLDVSDQKVVKISQTKPVDPLALKPSDLLPDIYAVGVVYRSPQRLEDFRDKLPNQLKSFLPRGQGFWALLPNGSNAFTEATFFASTPFVPFGLASTGVDGALKNKLGLGSVFTYNASKGTLEGGVGGTARLALPGGNNMVLWINGRSDKLTIKPPSKGEFTRSVNIGAALGLAKPTANILDFFSKRTAEVAVTEAATGVVPGAAVLTEPAALTTGASAVIMKGTAEAIKWLAYKGIADVYTGVGFRVTAKWMDGKFIGFYKGRNEITLAEILKMLKIGQEKTIEETKK